LLLFCLLGADLFVNYRVRRRTAAAHVVTEAH
jgi:simple sugar transport system permease protein